jgi:major vault protein
LLPGECVEIRDPALRADDGSAQLDKDGQVKLRYGHTEIRFSGAEPFPILPGEQLGPIKQLEFVPKHSALQLRATRDSAAHKAGDEWLFEGPAVYVPSAQGDVDVVQRVTGIVLGPLDGLHVKAKRDFVDRGGVPRKTGEMWLVRTPGAFIVGVDEELVQRVAAHLLTPTVALHLRATQSFTDVYGKQRRVGDEWLLTRDDSSTHMLDVHEQLVQLVPLTVVSPQQYAVVQNPHDADGKPQFGRAVNVRGPTTFFARPGEKVNGPSDVRVVGPSLALQVTALESFADADNVQRKAGDRWLVFGPTAYIPPVQVSIVRQVRCVFGIPALNLYVFPTARFYIAMILLIVYLIYWLFFSGGRGDDASATLEAVLVQGVSQSEL